MKKCEPNSEVLPNILLWSGEVGAGVLGHLAGGGRDGVGGALRCHALVPVLLVTRTVLVHLNLLSLLAILKIFYFFAAYEPPVK